MHPRHTPTAARPEAQTGAQGPGTQAELDVIKRALGTLKVQHARVQKAIDAHQSRVPIPSPPKKAPRTKR